MAMHPEFPEFKPIELKDRDFLQEILWRYQPQTSELTFTNLFIWRSHYGIGWSLFQDWLIILCSTKTEGFYALQPIGPPPRLEVVHLLLQWLGEEKKEKEPKIKRADQLLVTEIEKAKDLLLEPTRDHFDYVYRSQDLIHLRGRKYDSKRNHINKFSRTYSFTYVPLDSDYVKGCSELAENWCEWRRCEEDLNLLDEWGSVREALNHFSALKIEGGAILIGDKVEAFALGELLNHQTAVVHIEKANPQIPELYAMINQQFCERCWGNVLYVNREQDLGEPGLRKAKLSYYPHHLVEKFQIRIGGDEKKE
jgi:hypothetical protein